jgi:hypothetical protein
MGQLYATYGNDPDELARQISQSPWSAFFPEALTQARNAALLGTQQANIRQEMSGNIIKDWGQSMSTLYGNPTMETWLNLKSAALARAFDPKVKAAVSEQMDALGHTMFDNTGGDPEAIRRNILANYLHFGMTPETAAMLGGVPQAHDVRSGIQFIQPPGIFGRQPSAVGGVIPYGTAPTTITQPTGTMPGVGGGLQPGGALAIPPPGPGTNLALPQPTVQSPAPAPSAPSAAPAATQPGTSPTYGTQLPYATKRSGDMATYEKTLDTDVDNGATLYRNMNEIYDNAKKAQIGGGAGAWMALGKSLQAMGVNNDTVNRWANGDLAASQVMDKLALQNATSVMRQQLEGGGRYNMKEFVAFLNSNPNLTTDPHAMVEIFNLWNNYYQRDKAEQNSLNTAKKQPGFDINTWPNQWQNSSYMQKFSPGVPFTGEGVLGVMPSKGSDGIWRPRDKRELQELPKGSRYFRPGDNEANGPRTY